MLSGFCDVNRIVEGGQNMITRGKREGDWAPDNGCPVRVSKSSLNCCQSSCFFISHQHIPALLTKANSIFFLARTQGNTNTHNAISPNMDDTTIWRGAHFPSLLMVDPSNWQGHTSTWSGNALSLIRQCGVTNYYFVLSLPPSTLAFASYFCPCWPSRTSICLTLRRRYSVNSGFVQCYSSLLTITLHATFDFYTAMFNIN